MGLTILLLPLIPKGEGVHSPPRLAEKRDGPLVKVFNVGRHEFPVALPAVAADKSVRGAPHTEHRRDAARMRPCGPA